MKYLIIGGHGFIGSHFAKRLHISEYDIYDIGQPNDEPDEKTVLNRKIHLKQSISEEKMYKTFYDYVVHFGSFAGIRSGRPMNDYYDNNCLEYMKLLSKLSFNKLIYISSSSVLGNVRTAYSISKEICEEITRTYKDHLIVRPFTVYGENGRPAMFITRCMNGEHVKINGNPENISREFTYVEDLVNNIYNLQYSIGTYNSRGKHSYTLKDVLDIFGNEYEVGPESEYDFTSQKKDFAIDVYCETKIEYFKELIEKKDKCEVF